MRFVNLYIRTATLASLILAVSGCQTAQRPATLVPPSSAPALKPAPVTAPVSTPVSSQAEAKQAETKQQDPPQQAPAPEAVPLPAPGDSDAVADLVARAEKEYQAGLTNYRAGKTEDAKHNFDSALNSLLSSNFDVRSDERLQKEFDRIVQGVNEIYPGGTTGESDVAQEPHLAI